MDVIFNFIKNYFNFIVMVLFLISSAFLLYFDDKDYKGNDMKKEHRFVLIVGYAYIIVGVGVFVLVKVLGRS